eukprot:jgi/Undpi1/3493/HiC_scaffold_16.g06865.m1
MPAVSTEEANGNGDGTPPGDGAGASAAAPVIVDVNAAGLESTTDSKYVEMILFLHGNLDLIPQDIPKLTEAGARSKIPGRLVDPVEGLKELDGAFAPEDLTAGESGEVDV